MKISTWVLGLAFAAAAPAIAGCSTPSDKFLTAIGEADKVVLHEGLPHQLFEEELLADERKTKPVEELHGYPFYKELLDLRPEHARLMTRLLAERGTLQPFEGEKLCGGFHPDYAVEWRTGSETRWALLCFGCDEVKLFGPALEARHDMNEKASNDMQELLADYHKNRPPREH